MLNSLCEVSFAKSTSTWVVLRATVFMNYIEYIQSMKTSPYRRPSLSLLRISEVNKAIPRRPRNHNFGTKAQHKSPENADFGPQRQRTPITRQQHLSKTGARSTRHRCWPLTVDLPACDSGGVVRSTADFLVYRHSPARPSRGPQRYPLSVTASCHSACARCVCMGG